MSSLFTPIQIGSMTLRNRIVMSPMENQFGSPDGLPTERSIAYFEARARGGVGLITLGASSVDARHKEVPNSLHFSSDAVVDAHRALTDAVHEHGARIQPQLAHAGPDGLGPEMHRVDSLGPSAIQSYLTRRASREISVAELDEVVDLFRAAAVRVRAAGYDGIELHAAHAYMLLGSFLSPWRNARKDEYSAREPESRVRAVARVIRAIKSEVGEDFPLTLRISGYERVAGGRASFDTQRIAPLLEEAGVDAFHVSGGVIDRFVTQMVNGAHDPDGLNVAAAAAVKRVVDVPVMVVGRIHTPELAERIVREGSADLVVMGRPFLADPELPDKMKAGRGDEVRRCISCQNCIDAMETRFALDCAVNPATGREVELAPRPAAVRKHVVVVGGGPGGLEAARVAAQRGHRVSLYERAALLGGAMRMACTVHPENQPFLDWLLREVARLPVDVKLGCALSARDIEALGADAVILATGGRVVAPQIPGHTLPHVLTGSGLRELLAGDAGSEAAAKLPLWQRLGVRALGAGALGGSLQRALTPEHLRSWTRRWMPLGERVVIVGADLAAVELAEFLSERGRKVSVLTEAEDIAPEVGPKRRSEHMDRLDRAGVPLNTGVIVDHIAREGVVLRRKRASRLVPADSVILAGEVEPDTALYDALKDRVPELHAVGDCTGLGLIQKAALEGARAACRI